MKNFNSLFARWIVKESKNLTKQDLKTDQTKAKRTYLHFDERRHASSLSKYKKFFSNPDNIVKNAFWPFLHHTIKVTKIKNSNGKRKKKVKPRQVYYASHHDALIYSWYSFVLNESYYEDKLKKLGIDKSVIAYRQIPVYDGSNRNKCNVHFAEEVFSYIRKYDKECVAFVSDITGFFDNLDHEHLKKEWLSVLDLKETEELPADHQVIYENLTRFKYVDVSAVYESFNIDFKRTYKKSNGKGKVYQVPVVNGEPITSILNEPYTRADFVSKIVKNGLIKGNENRNNKKKCPCGIMQGSPISATLSNIYMLSFDKTINDLVKEKGGLYRRYSDDLVVVCKNSDYEEVKNKIQSEIKKFELEINDDKTDTTIFKLDDKGQMRGFTIDMKHYKNMQYLGFVFNGQKIYVRSSSLTKYYRKMKSVIRKTLSMAFGKKSKTKNRKNLMFKKSLYKRFLFKGQRSFISYALRSNLLLGGDSIKRQLGNRFNILHNYLTSKRRKRMFYYHKKHR